MPQRLFTLLAHGRQFRFDPPALKLPSSGKPVRRTCSTTEGHQASQILLRDVIGSPCFHQINSSFLSDHAGNNNERDVERGFFQDLQSLRSIELWQRMVGNNHVPRLRPESFRHFAGSLHAFDLRSIAGLTEFADNEIEIPDGILDD